MLRLFSRCLLHLAAVCSRTFNDFVVLDGGETHAFLVNAWENRCSRTRAVASFVHERVPQHCKPRGKRLCQSHVSSGSCCTRRPYFRDPTAARGSQQDWLRTQSAPVYGTARSGLGDLSRPADHPDQHQQTGPVLLAVCWCGRWQQQLLAGIDPARGGAPPASIAACPGGPSPLTCHCSSAVEQSSSFRSSLHVLRPARAVAVVQSCSSAGPLRLSTAASRRPPDVSASEAHTQRHL